MRVLYTYTWFLFLGCIGISYGQFDNPVTIPPPGNFGSTVTPETSSNDTAPKTFTSRLDDTDTSRPSLLEEQKNKFSMSKDYGFAKENHSYNPKWLDNNDVPMKDEYKKDKYFGDFRVKTKKAQLLCRDHMYVDGDRVRVLLNGEIIEYDLFLVSEYKVIEMNLKPGLNHVEVIALNQGSSGPNTAEFKVVDEDGNSITKNVWNLATGVKASFIIVQQ